MAKPKQSSSEISLNQYQARIAELVVARGFDTETVHEVFSLLVEEVGELAKAIRKTSGMKVDRASKEHSVEEEAADVFWLLIDLCNRLDINLAEAFEKKETINQQRNWTST